MLIYLQSFGRLSELDKQNENSSRFFMEKDIHIGNIIRQKLQEQERSGAWLARKLYTDSSNMSKILKRKHIDAGLLLRISLILGENLFDYYSDVYAEKRQK